MTLLEEINQNPKGASFVRADLHIHSFGNVGSYDVKDVQMTPQNIIDLAIKEGISVISITDHNSIGNVKVAIDYSNGKNLYVVPGVELSTTDGHLLIYLPDFDTLNKFYGALTISSDKKLCNQTAVQCLDMAGVLGGFGVAAHIELESGFEMYMKGYTPFKEALFTNRNLIGLEISSISSEPWFTDRDDVSERKGLLNARRKVLNEDNTYDVTKLMSSDAHQLTALGKNAVGNKKITRLKMDELDFHSFKIALLDSSARVRIEDLIPKSIPHFVGVKLDGGFLDGQVVRFSKNLTCIIGGRGAGKSTILESTRTTSGNGRSSMVDNDVWPDRISLLYEDETGRQQVFVKDKLKDVINATDTSKGITQVMIESFGQGETAETIQHSGKDPSVLIKFLDNFIDFENLKNDDEAICQELLDNQTSIERLTIEINTIPQIEKAKNNADEQVKALKANNAKEVVVLEEGLANEKALRSELVNHLNKLITGIDSSIKDKTVFNLVICFSEDKIIIGKEEFKDVKGLVESFSKSIDAHSVNINKDATDVVAKINEKLGAWTEKEKESLDKIEIIRKDIESKGGKLDIGFIRKVTKDASDYALALVELGLKKKELDTLKESRKELLTKRSEIKNKVFRKRYEFIYKVNENLKSTVIEFNIDVTLQQGMYSPALASIIKDAMGYRTSQVPRADLIVNKISYNDLLSSIRKKDSSLIQGIKNSDSSTIFSKTDADQIITTLGTPATLAQIERCSFEDLPAITLTRKYKDKDGKETFLQKDFSKLSLGQQQSVLLSILLFSNRNCPLLIDQPEDNLDSEFIYRTLVKNLRKIKEHRQVIIVTHNANIAVLGDAELIIPLRSTSDKSIITDRGSIDNTTTKKITCAILEGGEKAFIKRKDIYGL